MSDKSDGLIYVPAGSLVEGHPLFTEEYKEHLIDNVSSDELDRLLNGDWNSEIENES